MTIRYRSGDETVVIEATQTGEAWEIQLPGGKTVTIEQPLRGEGWIAYETGNPEVGGTSRLLLAAADTERGIEISHNGSAYVFTDENSGGAQRTAKQAGGVVSAPMVGVLADILVEIGDRVAAYQPVAIVESMKVMATIEAPCAGSVKHVYVLKGTQLTHGERILEIVPDEAK